MHRSKTNMLVMQQNQKYHDINIQPVLPLIICRQYLLTYLNMKIGLIKLKLKIQFCVRVSPPPVFLGLLNSYRRTERVDKILLKMEYKTFLDSSLLQQNPDLEEV